MSKAPAKTTLSTLLEDNLRKVLDDPELTPKERLAAIQVGLSIQQKIHGAAESDDKPFFPKR